MANGSHKKALASNIIFLSTLLKVLLFTAFFHALYRFLYHSSTVSIWLLLGFTMNSGVSALIYSQLRSMGLSGVELSAKGMVGYMTDIVYINIFVLVATALVSDSFWWTYSIIPIYAAYIIVTKLLKPGIFGGLGVDPVAVPGKTIRKAKYVR